LSERVLVYRTYPCRHKTRRCSRPMPHVRRARGSTIRSRSGNRRLRSRRASSPLSIGRSGGDRRLDGASGFRRLARPEFRSRSLYTAFWRDETASPSQRSQRPDIGFLDDSCQGHRIEDIQDLCASAFRAESRLQSHAGHWAAPCRFQRCIVGSRRADCLYDEDPKDHPYARCYPLKHPRAHCRAEGRVPTARSGLSFHTPSAVGLRGVRDEEQPPKHDRARCECKDEVQAIARHGRIR
jgi:hypothetical protein